MQNTKILVLNYSDYKSTSQLLTANFFLPPSSILVLASPIKGTPPTYHSFTSVLTVFLTTTVIPVIPLVTKTPAPNPDVDANEQSNLEGKEHLL